MLSDYLVDFKSLLDDVHCNEESFFWFKRFLQIVSLEAGRLVVDSHTANILKNYLNQRKKELSAIDHDPGTIREQTAITYILTRLPGGPSTMESDCISIRSMNVSTTSDYDQALLIMQEQKPRIDFYIYDARCPLHGKNVKRVFHYRDFNAYFTEGGEDIRIHKQEKQTVVYASNYGKPSTINQDEFRRQIQQFAQGELSFKIIDRYVFGGDQKKTNGQTVQQSVEKGVKILLAWLDLLTNDRSSNQTFDFTVFTQRHPQMTNQVISSLLNENWGGDKPKCKIHFVFIGGDEAFHDRFICSKHFYFAIGRGLDGYETSGVKKLFNLYYCGRIIEGQLPLDINQVTSIESCDQLSVQLETK